MTSFDLVLVPFPFANLEITKKRPCVILSRVQASGLPEHFIVAMITSQINSRGFPQDFILQDWERSGLPKPSLVRPAKLVSISSDLVIKKLGRMTKRDQLSLRKAVSQIFREVL